MKIYIPTRITTEAEAEALPEGTLVVVRDEDLTEYGDSPLIYVKDDGVFSDWQGHHLTSSEIVPITALVEHEVEGRTERAYGAIGPGLLGGTALHTGFGGDQEPHERKVWSTEWKRSEES